MSKVTSESINKQNKITILNRIRQDGTVSRADLSKGTGISAPTVTRIVNSLITVEGLVQDLGAGDSGGGRPPNLVSFSGSSRYIIGIDLSPHTIYGILSDLNSSIISEVRIPTFVEEGFEPVIRRAAGVVEQLIRQSGLAEEKILGIGLGIAGFLDIRKNMIITSPVFNWHNVKPEEELRKYIDLPIIFDNISRVLAIGELHYGIGKDFQTFLAYKIGLGFGASLIHEGKPYLGAHGSSCELGHTIIDFNNQDIPCSCGNRGCVESLASGRYLLKLIHEQDGETSINLDNNTLEVVLKKIKENPEQYESILNKMASNISISIVNGIHTFDPQAVVLGGMVMQLGDLLLEKIRKTVREGTMTHYADRVEIFPATHQERAVAMGAVALIIDKVLQLELV